MKYQLITDATADLTTDLDGMTPDLEIIPMEVELDGAVRLYGPGGDLTVEEFYRCLREGQFGSTSQIRPETYREIFEKYLEQGQDILYLCFTSGLSATWQNACMCAEELSEKYPERTIRCIDTLCASIGEGFLVYEAALRWKSGEELPRLVEWAEAHKHNVCHWFTVDTLEYLKKGGRIGRTAAAVGNALQIKPLLKVSDSGELVIAGKTRGRHQARSAKIKEMEKSWMPEEGHTVFIGHGDDMEHALKLQEEIQERFPEADCHILPIGPVIGMHTGPGMQAVIFWGKKR